MVRYCILVADGARARFFQYEARPWEPGMRRPSLVERADLVNPERTLAAGAIYTEAHSSAHTATATGHHAAYDDHREKSRREDLRRFARRVVERLAALAREGEASGVVVCAGPELLGLLRPELERGLERRLPVREVLRDLTHESADAILLCLTEEGVFATAGAPAK
jgi:protein required for attachment to host cells